MKENIIQQRELHLDKKAHELQMAEIELAEKRILITMLQHPGHLENRPTPKTRKGKFKRKALKKEQLISEPSGMEPRINTVVL